MKLLFDQNLAPRLVQRLVDLFPESAHVASVGLSSAQYARNSQFVIVSKDADFNELNMLWGSPPKVIWIRRGNCSTKEIEKLLRDNAKVISDFAEDNEVGTLVLF
jgi:predicted nuclease of predicted toxin-antitoxin system